jgi:hypothetical protein
MAKRARSSKNKTISAERIAWIAGLAAVSAAGIGAAVYLSEKKAHASAPAPSQPITAPAPGPSIPHPPPIVGHPGFPITLPGAPPPASPTVVTVNLPPPPGSVSLVSQQTSPNGASQLVIDAPGPQGTIVSMTSSSTQVIASVPAITIVGINKFRPSLTLTALIPGTATLTVSWLDNNNNSRTSTISVTAT